MDGEYKLIYIFAWTKIQVTNLQELQTYCSLFVIFIFVIKFLLASCFPNTQAVFGSKER